MTRYYAAILFLVSALASNASAQQTKDGLLRGNNSGEAVGNMGDSGLGNRRLQVTSVRFQAVAFNTDRSIKDISVNKDGSSGWGIGLDGSTYKTYKFKNFECENDSGCGNRLKWNDESNGKMSGLSANSISFSGNSNHVWAVAYDIDDRSSIGKDLYRGFTVDQWMNRDQPRGVSFKQLSVSFCGKHVYAVDTEGSIWYKEVSGENEPAWIRILTDTFSSLYSYVAVDKGDYVWAIVKNSKTIQRYDVQSKQWSPFGALPSSYPKTISVDKLSTSVWVVDDRNALWYSNGRGGFTSVSVSSGQKISIASVSANGKKLFAVSVNPHPGDTLMAQIDTRTLAATVDEDEDEDCYHPEDHSKATIATVKST